jgi:hypothetical protein
MIPSRVSNVPEAVNDTLLLEASSSSAGHLTHCSLAQDLQAANVPPRLRPCAAEDVRYPKDAFLSGLEDTAREHKRDAVGVTSTYLLVFQLLPAGVQTTLVQGPIDADTTTTNSGIC